MRTIAIVMLAACGSGGAGAIDAAPAIDAAVDGPAPVVEDLHLLGRFDAQGRLAWPGTAIATRFEGTAVSIELDDFGLNWFAIAIDGVAQPPLHVANGRRTYVLASGLPAGAHDLVIARRTEAFFRPTTFHGFPGAQLIATERPARLIELIGDSITCGYGVLDAGPSCEFGADTESEPHAWGAFAAAALDAAHVSIAYSGIGMLRNNSGSTTDTMPARYGRILADDPASTWSFAAAPDVIVVALGTNDFAAGDPGAPFVAAYTDFVAMLRGRFPTAPILLATSPMLGGAARATLRGYLDDVAAADPRVSVVEIAEQAAADGYGCDAHPSVTTQQKMADALVVAIRAATGW